MIKEIVYFDNFEYFGIKDIVIINVYKFFYDNSLFDDFFKFVIVDEVYYYLVSMWWRIVDKCKNYVMVVFFIVILFRGDKKLVLKDEDGELVYNLFFEEVRI